jgi:cysteine-S-conjugate beta-lyase
MRWPPASPHSVVPATDPAPPGQPRTVSPGTDRGRWQTDTVHDTPDFAVSDAELRAAGSLKWAVAGPDVLPAWVAEMDVRPCPPVTRALHEAVGRGTFGYLPPPSTLRLPETCAAFVTARFGLPVDPRQVVLSGDVMGGIRLVLDTVCEPAPVIVPLPTYPPFLSVVPLTGRVAVPVAAVGDGDRMVLDLDGIARALAEGARTVLLSQPHNPLGRVFSEAELTGLRDLVLRHGARVISDEIHAPLVLPGVRHLPYAAIEGTAGHVTTLVSASKAWNMPGLKSAQIIAGSAEDLAALQAVPFIANHGTSPLGAVAATAAYEHGGPWLDGVLGHLAAQRDRFSALLATHLPDLSWQPPEATYLAWVDARPTGLDDPAGAAHEVGRVLLSDGADFGPGYAGFVRINLATSAERLERIVQGLAHAWTAAG